MSLELSNDEDWAIKIQPLGSEILALKCTTPNYFSNKENLIKKASQNKKSEHQILSLKKNDLFKTTVFMWTFVNFKEMLKNLSLKYSEILFMESEPQTQAQFLI